MTTITDKICGNCQAFVVIKGHPSGAGTCRRRAPVPLVQRYFSGSTLGEKGEIVQVLNGLVDGFFPPTVPSLSCMEFVRKEVSFDASTLEIPGLVPVEEPPATH